MRSEQGWQINVVAVWPCRPSEAAKVFGVHPATIRRWCRHLGLQPIRTVGGQSRYPKSVISKLLKEGERHGFGQ